MGGGGKGSKKVTVGYRYSWDVQAGLGRGPVNEIVSIMADKKTVFAGTPGQISSSTSVYIDKPGLFGGDDTGGEGGIQGQLDIMMGEPDQVPPASLLKLLTGLVPGFRGVVTTFFSGLVSCYSASPKPWLYRVRRTTKGWDGDVWYPEKATIMLENSEAQLDDEADLLPEQLANLRAIHAMNPAHILVECATNRDWGRQLTLADDLNLDSYRVAADTLFEEGFGLCFRYNRQDGLDTFVQQILDHVGAVQYADLETGKLTLKLLRGDYNVDDLPVFTYDNGIIAVQDDDSASTTSNPNEVVVTWNDPVTNSDGEVRAQNLGAIQNTGLNSSSVEYKAIPTHSLAERVAQRDLETAQSELTRLVIQFDRRGGILRPGDVFRVRLPDRNIDNMVLRVGKIEIGDVSALTLKLSFEQSERKISRAGVVMTSDRRYTSFSASLASVWHDFSADNLSLLLFGKTSRIAQSWQNDEALPKGITAGDRVALAYQNVREVSIDGLAEGTGYEVDYGFGAISFLTTPQSQPVKVTYDYAGSQSVSLLNAKSPEVSLRYEGINLAEGGKKVLLELWRMTFDPLTVLELINNATSLSGMETSSAVLPDLNRQAADVFGLFGRIVMIEDFMTITYDGTIDFDGKYNFAY
ncbi:TPA: phage tail protein [Klebsiella quasipneumoniae subsp. quasipneumoniae]